MMTHKLNICVPGILPLKNLQSTSFATILKQAHRSLAKFNVAISDCSAKGNEILFAEEVKSSHAMSLSAVRSIRRKRRFSIRLLCATHALIQKGSKLNGADVGKIRNRQNWIGPEKRGEEDAYFFPPNIKDLRRGLKNLTEYLLIDEDPLVQCAISFAQLLILHPFMDGNGRVARLMIPVFLYQKKALSKPLFFMGHYFKKNRLRYFQKLYYISTKKQWEGWIRFFLQGVVEEGERLVKKLSREK
jgi:Fic family protein